MAVLKPLPAASVIVLRDDPLEVLMLRRNDKSSFVPGAWVFPGGIAEEGDAEIANGDAFTKMRVTGARETFEETGVWLGLPLDDAEQKRRRLLAGSVTFRHLLGDSPIDFERLVWTARWITPEGLPTRFDTYFFLAKVTHDVVATAEQQEAVDVVWISPAEALSRAADGRMQMVFPTRRNLEALEGWRNADALIDSRRGARIETIQPILVNGKPTLP